MQVMFSSVPWSLFQAWSSDPSIQDSFKGAQVFHTKTKNLTEKNTLTCSMLLPLASPLARSNMYLRCVTVSLLTCSEHLESFCLLVKVLNSLWCAVCLCFTAQPLLPGSHQLVDSCPVVSGDQESVALLTGTSVSLPLLPDRESYKHLVHPLSHLSPTGRHRHTASPPRDFYFFLFFS